MLSAACAAGYGLVDDVCTACTGNTVSAGGPTATCTECPASASANEVMKPNAEYTDCIRGGPRQCAVLHCRCTVHVTDAAWPCCLQAVLPATGWWMVPANPAATPRCQLGVSAQPALNARPTHSQTLRTCQTLRTRHVSQVGPCSALCRTAPPCTVTVLCTSLMLPCHAACRLCCRLRAGGRCLHRLHRRHGVSWRYQRNLHSMLGQPSGKQWQLGMCGR